MSVYVTSVIWRHYPNGTEMLTALALADIADDKGFCIYSDTDAKTIGDKTIQSERSVRYHMHTMQKLGWLEIVENHQGGRGKFLKLRIPVERVPMGAVGRVQNLQPFKKTVIDAGDQPQDVVSDADQSLQKLPPSPQRPQKVAIHDRKVASHDTKGGNSEHPSNIGYVVHKNTCTAPAGADALFERFWQAYPRKTAKHTARAKFKQLKVNDELLAKMLASIGAHKGTDQWKRDVVPHAATWLNQRRWEDSVGGYRAPEQQQPRTCTYRTDRTGGVCGMPAVERFGGDDLCGHHKEKILNAGPMPAEARAKLDQFLRKGGKKPAGSEVPV